MRPLALLLAVVAAAAMAAAAGAAGPVITPFPSQDYVDPTCGFPVNVGYTTNGETLKAFSDGRLILTGPLKATFTANRKSVSLNIAGPLMLIPNPDGSV